MSDPTESSAATSIREPIPSSSRTLRRLFLTLFLRGRATIGTQAQKAPKSIGQTLGITLLIYAAIGIVAVSFGRLPVFALAVYLHSMTFAFLAMFLTSSAGAVLFNEDEADILLHRPICSRSLLWAKVSVLLEASLWIAGAFNLAGFCVGFMMADGGWRFVFAHALSTAMEAAFCAACVVMAYQLCLRWCGRERLDALITTSQVVLSIGGILGSQILPRVMFQDNKLLTINRQSWWMMVLPPAWFAGLDDLVSGQRDWSSVLLAGLAIVATLLVMWIAFDRLARDYELGLQKMNESVATRPQPQSGRRWIDLAADAVPLRWWLRDPVTRSSFLLTTAYLLRDRDVKLRVYPAIAPMMIMPFMMLLQKSPDHLQFSNSFPIAFAGSFMGTIPMIGMVLLQYSRNWQASDIFRMAPLSGPAALCHGVRKAVMCWIVLPVVVGFALMIWLLNHNLSSLALLLPGVIALLPIGLVPIVIQSAIPFSRPAESAQAERNYLVMFGQIFFAFLLTGLTIVSWIFGWFIWFILGETVVAIAMYATLRRACSNLQWRASE